MSDACKTCPSKSGEDKTTCGAAQVAKSMQDIGLTSTLAKIKHKILVMSGKGGVGKSTIATNLALGLAKKGFQVGTEVAVVIYHQQFDHECPPDE